MRAVCTLRKDIEYRRSAFCEGLQAAGYTLVDRLLKPEADDLLLTWNRYGINHYFAELFERAGAKVFVTENGWLGKNWRGQNWYALSKNHHAGAGSWADGGPSRWDGWSVELAPWRTEGERIILAQRGIGEPGIASPAEWAERIRAAYGGRIRKHPGKHAPAVSLEDDLSCAGEVVTWTSGAALKALVMGVPVRCAFPKWIGASASCAMHEELRRDDAARLAMFRRMAWAMWTIDEIRTGEPFTR
jgi:hypothetical protein